MITSLYFFPIAAGDDPCLNRAAVLQYGEPNAGIFKRISSFRKEGKLMSNTPKDDQTDGVKNGEQ